MKEIEEPVYNYSLAKARVARLLRFLDQLQVFLVEKLFDIQAQSQNRRWETARRSTREHDTLQIVFFLCQVRIAGK